MELLAREIHICRHIGGLSDQPTMNGFIHVNTLCFLCAEKAEQLRARARHGEILLRHTWRDSGALSGWQVYNEFCDGFHHRKTAEGGGILAASQPRHDIEKTVCDGSCASWHPEKRD